MSARPTASPAGSTQRRITRELRPLEPARERRPFSDVLATHRRYKGTGDGRFRERLVAAYEPLALHLAARFARRGEPFDDLVQVAMLGLLHAIDRFDPDRGVQFSTFGSATISGELKRHFRDRGWAMRVPRRVQERWLGTRQALDVLTVEKGRSPTIGEIAWFVGCSDEEVLEALEADHAYRALSLDAPVHAQRDRPRPMEVGTDDQGLALVDQRETLQPLLARLPDRSRLILKLRFADGLTQTEIAHQVGLSQMHVSRLLLSTLDQLRAWAEPN